MKLQALWRGQLAAAAACRLTGVRQRQPPWRQAQGLRGQGAGGKAPERRTGGVERELQVPCGGRWLRQDAGARGGVAAAGPAASAGAVAAGGWEPLTALTAGCSQAAGASSKHRPAMPPVPGAPTRWRQRQQLKQRQWVVRRCHWLLAMGLPWKVWTGPLRGAWLDLGLGWPGWPRT